MWMILCVIDEHLKWGYTRAVLRGTGVLRVVMDHITLNTYFLKK